MIKEIALFIILICFLTLSDQAQDAPSSQWYSNLVQLNPSHAGSASRPRVNLFYRNQWPSNFAGFTSYGFSFDTEIKKYHVGLGTIVTNNNTAAFQKPTFHLIYAYHIKTNYGVHINFGLKTGIIQEFLNASNITLEKNSEIISSGPSKLRFDFGGGISIYSKNIFGGLAIDHINKPAQGNILTGEIRLNRKVTLDLGYIIDLQTRLIQQDYWVMPSVIFQQQGAQQNLQLGVLSQVNHLLSGVWVRKNLYLDAPAIIFLVGYRTFNTRFAYSCDINSNLKMLRGNAAHEVSITRLFAVRNKKVQKTIGCPSFLQ